MYVFNVYIYIYIYVICLGPQKDRFQVFPPIGKTHAMAAMARSQQHSSGEEIHRLVVWSPLDDLQAVGKTTGDRMTS